MSFTDRSYNMDASGFASVALADGRISRLAIFGDSTCADQVVDRYDKGWICCSCPAGPFIGFAHSFAATMSATQYILFPAVGNLSRGTAKDPTVVTAPATTISSYTIGADCEVTCAGAHGLSTGAVVDIVITGNAGALIRGRRAIVVTAATKWKFSPALDTTGETSGAGTYVALIPSTFYTTPTSGFWPSMAAPLIWAAGGVGGNPEIINAGIFPALPSTATQKLYGYSHIDQVRSPGWWMPSVDWTFGWHDPSLATHGVAGADLVFYDGRDTDSLTLNAAIGTVTGGTGTIRSVTGTLAAATDARKTPTFSVRNGTDGQLTKQITPLVAGWVVHGATEGLFVFSLGQPSYRAGDWAAVTAPTDATLTSVFGMFGAFHGIVVHLGNNLTAAQNTELAAGTKTTFKADLKADLARFRRVVGNVPICLVMVYRYLKDVASGGTFGADAAANAVGYQTMLDAMKEICDEIPACCLHNNYTGIGDNFAHLASVVGSPGRNVVTTNGYTDPHPGEHGKDWYIAHLWSEVRNTDNSRRRGRARVDRLRRV